MKFDGAHQKAEISRPSGVHERRANKPGWRNRPLRSESEGREDHIRLSDRAYSAVRFVYFGNGDKEVRHAEDFWKRHALSSAGSLLRRAGLTVQYPCIPHLSSRDTGPSRRGRAAHLHRWKPNRGQSQCGYDEMEGQKGDLVLDAPARSLLPGLLGGDGRAGKSDTEGEKGRTALVKKTEADYDLFPQSYDKKVIRAARREDWQQRYDEGSSGEVTKCFFPRVDQAFTVLR
ncbi:hypothetical protein EVAR_61199_1 [Eumeta japonica]|uniref:Uncharacterized protein n=1 Tax=Eumeta variegata TaxID=151549 RepID=A0A4C1YZ48_EUMVA|nr:hypothetical protein EVAR_61199_1 [Eumeta japonica]